MMAKRFRQTKPAVPRDVEASLRKQAFAAPRVVELMNAIRTDEEKPLCIEFFFYAKEEPDAGRLVAALSVLGYNAQHYHSAHSGKYSINGWTPPLPSDAEAMGTWSKAMVRLAVRFHAEFDGWGTFPEQEEGFFDLIQRGEESLPGGEDAAEA